MTESAPTMAARAEQGAAMREEILSGLSATPKSLSPKYFYDKRGSELFEEITRLQEYYPTRTERGLLERWVPEWVEISTPATLVELGAGSGAKSRIILDAFESRAPGSLYVPVDVSAAFLQETAEGLRAEYDHLDVHPVAADMAGPLSLPAVPKPVWVALLGSTIGNFADSEAVALMTRTADYMGEGDRLLLGVDLGPGPRKSVERLELAYNDPSGVTAEFNRNILRVLNREVGTDFDPDAFVHRAFFVEEKSRIEMHLEAVGPQAVRIPADTVVHFADGERVRTEISCKYDRHRIDLLFAAAGLIVDTWAQDPDDLFALILARRRG